jgi:hypothetical protein
MSFALRYSMALDLQVLQEDGVAELPPTPIGVYAASPV